MSQTVFWRTRTTKTGKKVRERVVRNSGLRNAIGRATSRNLFNQMVNDGEVGYSTRGRSRGLSVPMIDNVVRQAEQSYEKSERNGRPSHNGGLGKLYAKNLDNRKGRATINRVARKKGYK